MPQKLVTRLISTGTQQNHAETRQWLEQVRQYREAFADVIIADGLTSGDWTEVLGPLAEVHTRESKEILDGFFEKVEAAMGADAMTVPMPASSGLPDATEGVDELLYSHALQWGEIGFLLGLAVGMQLGPNAFGGDR